MRKLILAAGFAAVASFGFAEDAYIESTGTQAILTDVLINGKSRVEFDFQACDGTIQSHRLFGQDSAPYSSLLIQDGKFAFVGGDTWTRTDSTVATNKARHVAIADYNNRHLAIQTGGVTDWETDITYAMGTGTASIGLCICGVSQKHDFTWDGIYHPGTADHPKLRVYSCKVYESGALKHYFKPWKSGRHTGLKDLCTGKIYVNGATADPFLCGGDISDDPQWDLPETQPTVVPPVIPQTGDYVIDTPRFGSFFLPRFETAARVVKTGSGKLTLDDGNVFGGDFIVSNGCVEADYATSGLRGTHLQLSGAKNNAPGIISPLGPSFTPTVAASGAGTVAFYGYCGVRPANTDLTVDFGAEVVKGSAAFNPSEFDLGMSSYQTLTFASDLAVNANSITVKNPGTGSQLPARITGYWYNKAGLNSGTSAPINYWDGTIVFVGNPQREWDLYAFRGWQHNCGTQIFSNCNMRVTKDWKVGNNSSVTVPAVEYFKDSNWVNSDAWNFISGPTGTTLTVDGGVWTSEYRIVIGDTPVGKVGTLVLTNDVKFGCGTFRVNNGTINQYGGSMTVTTADGDLTGIGLRGDASDATTSNANSRDSFFNLYGGELKVANNKKFYVGASHNGTLTQTGGSVTIDNHLAVGFAANAVGRYALHGGTFSQCASANAGSATAVVGDTGDGALTVAGTGKFTTKVAQGVQIGKDAKGKGRVVVGDGGTVEAARFFGGAGASKFVFAGGTAKPNATAYASAFLDSSLGSAEVAPSGGAIDTTAGDIAFAKPLTAADTTDATYESLTHRWTFEAGSLKDDAGDFVAETVGSVTAKDGSVLLAGGPAGSSQVKLGNVVIPTDGRGWTIEMWFTQRSAKNFSRIFECGFQKNSDDLFISTNRGGTGGKSAYYFLFGTENRNNSAWPDSTLVLQDNVMYHMAFTMEKQTNGRWKGSVIFHEPGTGKVLADNYVLAPSGWSPARIDQSKGLWLGNGAWGDPDPNIEYYEVRTYNRAVSAAELTANAVAGLHAPISFRKTGANKLTLMGANAYKAGTAVEAGTLALASGATLPPTDVAVASGATLDLAGTAQTVKRLSGAGTVRGGSVAAEIQPGGKGAIGTLTLDGAAVTDGTLVIDVAADGAADKLVTTGALDLSKLSLVVTGVDKATKKGLCKIVSGPVSGMFKSVSLPRGWSVSVTAAGVDFMPNGLAIIVR